MGDELISGLRFSALQDGHSPGLAVNQGMLVAKERVLLVDDEPQILTALEDLLGDNYTIFKSSNPESALTLVEQNRDIAVVITDQRMPRMNGDEFLRKIGEHSLAVRIMVSGFADLPAVLRAVNDGKVYAYVTKPWDEEDLLSKVQTAAAHFRLAQELEYERRLLCDLMDNSPDGIYFKDAELRFLRANSSFMRGVGGADPEALVGRRLSDVLGAEADSSEEEERRILQQRQPMLDVVRRHNSAGKTFFTSETKAPIKGRTGQALGLVGITRDVTERIKTSEALRESEARLQHQSGILNSILDGMGDGVVVVGQDGRTLLINKAAERLFGVPKRDVAAASWPEAYGLFLPDGSAHVPLEMNPFQRAISGEPLVQLELRVKNSVVNGAIVAITATPLRDPSADVIGVIALLHDVTEQRSLQQQLLQSQKMEAIGKLAGGVAHDFNNLLTVIVGCSELALEDFDSVEARRANVTEVLTAARNASLLTQQLLAFSRRQVVQAKALQLNDVVTNMNSVLQRLIGAEIELTAVLRRDLSPVLADQSQVEQIVLNLVVNARDAMPSGGVIRLETDEEQVNDTRAAEFGVKPGRFVCLTVVDTGTGMSEATRSRIFEPFFTTKEAGKGTGLGLSTVFGIVRQSGGHIQVDSAPGQGTEFRVWLPRAVLGEPNRQSMLPELGGSVLGNILLIDGDDAVRQITARMLRSKGHVVTEASTLNDARKLLTDTRNFDLVLTDIGMTGPEFARELSSLPEDVRVLLMTGGGPLIKDAPKALTDESTLLAKPFSRHQLLEKVEEALLGAQKVESVRAY